MFPDPDRAGGRDRYAGFDLTASRVLVTGGSGFLGAHCILGLLRRGYHVRTTLRSADRQTGVLATLRRAGFEPGEALEFAVADHTRDTGWNEAVKGCEFVLHVASPFPAGEPRDENELIEPACEGTLRVLRAARDAGVQRVVVTSSFAAIGYGRAPPGRPFTEDDWSDPAAPISAYVKSKTIAERAAWDFIDREGGSLELAAINPVGIFGPVLSADTSTSIGFVKSMMEGRIPLLPRLTFGVVDVRDVADLHIEAMTHPAAAGERFLAVSGNFMTVQEIARTLKSGLGQGGSKISTRAMPDWLVRLAAVFSRRARLGALPDLGVRKNATSEKAQRLLKWTPRPREEALIATGERLLRFGSRSV